MVYGSGYASADDVVGHELAHGVTDFSAHLFYYYQAGAINESLSDVFGELIDQSDGRGNDTAAVRWQMGEDLPIGAIRDMRDPTAFNDPDRIQSPNYFSGPEDRGGVHFNSGVNNKAAFLMTDGGVFNGRTVTALGLTKTAKINYEAQSNMLTSGSDYNDLYHILPQACNQLVGTIGITVANCVNHVAAVIATQMNLQPTTGVFHPEAPICAAGQVPTDLFYDNLENTASGNWTKGRIQGASNWAYPQSPNDYPGYDATVATSGKYNMWGDNPETTADFWIGKAVGVTVPAGKQTFLRFKHLYEFESGFSSNYDGGVIEYSINNGASWVDAGSLFKSAGDWGYQGSIASGLGNPLGGRQGYVGRSDGYFSSRATLTELAGKSVRFRYRIGADGSIGSYGWYLDDLRVYTCAAPVAPPPTTNKLQNPGFELDNNDDGRLDFWSWDSSALRMPTVKRTGQYALWLRAVDNQPFVFGQTVTGLTQGTTYTTQGYFNIPATTKLVNARLKIKWRNSANAIISTTVVKAYTDDNAGVWQFASVATVAPTATNNARVQLVVNGLSSTVYVDDLVFRP